MNVELISNTSRTIAVLRDQLVSVMMEASDKKEPIIQKIIETALVIRDLYKT